MNVWTSLFLPVALALSTAATDVDAAGVCNEPDVPAREVPAAPSSRATFADRRSIEALDRLARFIDVSRGKQRFTITLPSDDYFDAGSVRLAAATHMRLDDIAAALAAQSGRAIAIRAYTDSLGDKAESVRVSLLRAAALRDYFVSRGVPRRAIEVEGLGPEHPVAGNDTPEGRAANRRVEIAVEDPPSAPTSTRTGRLASRGRPRT